MREIKFRAWDNDIKKMYPVSTLDSDGKLTFTHHALPEDTQAGTDCRHLINYELMQFTGLHDSKGKEIWEGDLIKNASRNEVKLHEVRWMDGKFLGVYGRLAYDLYCEVREIEVIGNIYENPELLEAK